MNKVLITGGAGYIGSHTAVALQDNGFAPVIVDNLSNSKAAVISRIQKITKKNIEFHVGDLQDISFVESLFAGQEYSAVIHFAGLKAVGESVKHPLEYYDNNIISTLNLLRVMEKFGCRRLVFSSSATVYGDPEFLPIRENHPISPTNPYGRTKAHQEAIMKDLCHSNPDWRILLLRYFNPVGSHESGLIGEDPNGLPNNLFPVIRRVIERRIPELTIFGNDYPTADGTCIRDYIHVVDLAEAHLAAVRKISSISGALPINLGTGKGYSVLEVVRAFEKATALPMPFRYASRRQGDVAACFSDSSSAHKNLGWKALRGLTEMVRSSLNYRIP